MTAESALKDTADKTVRIPAGVMSLIRQSYDTRERVLDWWLAISVTAALAYVFRDQLYSFVYPFPGPDAGKVDAPVPNQDVRDAFPEQYAPAATYTYNLPASRQARYGVGPSGTGVPRNPAGAPCGPICP